MTTSTPPSAPEFPARAAPNIGEWIGVRAGYCGGKPHILGHRIKVQHVAVRHERMGMTAEEIVATYPTLSLAAVYAALTYYHSHPAEIDADIEADERLVAEMQAQADSSCLSQRLAELHAKNDSLPPGVRSLQFGMPFRVSQGRPLRRCWGNSTRAQS